MLTGVGKPIVDWYIDLITGKDFFKNKFL